MYEFEMGSYNVTIFLKIFGPNKVFLNIIPIFNFTNKSAEKTAHKSKVITKAKNHAHATYNII